MAPSAGRLRTRCEVSCNCEPPRGKRQLWTGATSLPPRPSYAPRSQATLSAGAQHTKDVVNDRAHQQNAAEVAAPAFPPALPHRARTARRARTTAGPRRGAGVPRDTPSLGHASLALVLALLFARLPAGVPHIPDNSDEANDLLMAWDMLHGHVNCCTAGAMSDVSFSTPTELPQYALLVSFLSACTRHRARGRGDDLHAAGVLAVILAQGKQCPRGRRPGRATGRARPPAALPGGLTVARIPPGCCSPAGSSLRASARRRSVHPAALGRAHRHVGAADADVGGHRRVRHRWCVAAIAGRPAARLGARRLPARPGGGVLPLAVVCLLRIMRRWRPAAVTRAGPDGCGPCVRARGTSCRWPIAALAAWPAASTISRLLSTNGGYVLHPIGYQFAQLDSWPKHARVTTRAGSRCSAPRLRGRRRSWPSRCCTWPASGWSRGRCAGGAPLPALSEPGQPGAAGRDRHQRRAYIPSTLAKHH